MFVMHLICIFYTNHTLRKRRARIANIPPIPVGSIQSRLNVSTITVGKEAFNDRHAKRLERKRQRQLLVCDEIKSYKPI